MAFCNSKVKGVAHPTQNCQAKLNDVGLLGGPMPVPETLGERIKAARTALGLTQERLAAPTLTKSFISHLERNTSSVSLDTLEQLAGRLQKPLSHFVLGDPHSRIAGEVLDTILVRAENALAHHRCDAAIMGFTEGAMIARERGDPGRELQAITGHGETLAASRRLEEAKPLLKDALTRSRAARDARIESRALMGLGLLEQRSANFAAATALYDSAASILSRLDPPEPSRHGQALLFLGMTLLRMGRLEEASENFREGERIFEEAHLPARVGESLANYGLALHLSGDHDAALLALERACVLLREYEDLHVLSWARNNLGMVLLEIGRAREAREHFSISLAIKRRVGDVTRQCHTLTELARCHFSCGELAEARAYAKDAIALTRKGFAPDEVPRAQIVLASIAITEGGLRKARRYLDAAARYCEQTSMRLELVTVYRELARVTAMSHRFKEADRYHAKAFGVLRTMAPHDAAAALRMASLVARTCEPAAGAGGVPFWSPPALELRESTPHKVAFNRLK